MHRVTSNSGFEKSWDVSIPQVSLMYDIHTVQEFWKMWAETLSKGNGTGLKLEGIDICYKMAAGTPHVSHIIPVGFDRMAEIHKTMPPYLRDIVKMHYYTQVYKQGAKPWLRMGLSQSKYYRLLSDADYHAHGRLWEKGLTNT